MHKAVCDSAKVIGGPPVAFPRQRETLTARTRLCSTLTQRTRLTNSLAPIGMSGLSYHRMFSVGALPPVSIAGGRAGSGDLLRRSQPLKIPTRRRNGSGVMPATVSLGGDASLMDFRSVCKSTPDFFSSRLFPQSVKDGFRHVTDKHHAFVSPAFVSIAVLHDANHGEAAWKRRSTNLGTCAEHRAEFFGALTTEVFGAAA